MPATVDLSGAELELYTERDRNYRLRIARWSSLPQPGTDISYVLIDCPPALSLLTVNAMAAAHAVVVPLQCEFFALEGLSMLAEDHRAGAQRAEPDPGDPRHYPNNVR